MADTTMEFSIAAKREVIKDRKTYMHYGWLVKSKEVGWFFSTDDKWATKQETITTNKK